MGRLIDEEDAINALMEEFKRTPTMAIRAKYTIEQLSPVQPEIIHCQNCKHWQSEEHIGNNNVHTLNLASLPCKNWLTAGDWYCGSAERREDG